MCTIAGAKVQTGYNVYFYGCLHFKHYYLFFIKGTMKSYFPKAASYNRFVELESRVFSQLMFFLNLGAFGRGTGITFLMAWEEESYYSLHIQLIDTLSRTGVHYFPPSKSLTL